jgi:hypothetical protein
MIGRIRVESDNGTFDVLHSKGLLNRRREPNPHTVMEEHHRWKTFRFLDTGYPK